MRIFTSSADLITQVLGTMPLNAAPVSARLTFDSFDFDDLNAPGERQFFETQCESFGNWDNIILERNAASSQLVRLRQWRGPSVMTVALTGNGFIGQKNRVWQTFEGNLHWCCAIPVKLPVACAEQLQMLPAVCMHEVLQPHWKLGIQCRIKRPNDIILLLPEQHKVAGCLTEMRANDQSVEMVRYGLSINLVAAPEHVEPGHLPAACCMPYFKNGDNVYRAILLALSRSILENVRRLENNPQGTDLRRRFDCHCSL